MFKLLALFAGLALTAASAFAQTAPAAATTATPGAPAAAKHGHHQQKSPEAMAAHRSQKLAQQLGLSPEQQSKLQAALLAERQAMTSTAPGAPADRHAMHQAMQANHAQYQAQVKTILTPEQYTKFLALQQQKHDQARAKKKKHTGLNANS